jgi:hypothetical protein
MRKDQVRTKMIAAANNNGDINKTYITNVTLMLLLGLFLHTKPPK